MFRLKVGTLLRHDAAPRPPLQITHHAALGEDFAYSLPGGDLPRVVSRYWVANAIAQPRSLVARLPCFAETIAVDDAAQVRDLVAASTDIVRDENSVRQPSVALSEHVNAVAEAKNRAQFAHCAIARYDVISIAKPLEIGR